MTTLTTTRRQLKIDPRTPLRDLLPVAPQSAGKTGKLLPEDLAEVPEVVFQEPPPRDLPGPKAADATALTIARINLLNHKETDGFLRALLGRRTDLAGLPFALGEAARLGEERSRQLNLALTTLRQMRQQQGGTIAVRRVTQTVQEKLPSGEVRTGLVLQDIAVPQTQQGPVGQDCADGFWEAYQKACVQEDRAARRCDREHQEQVTRARIAALMQVLAPESPALRKGLVHYLSTVPHVEATRALARLALFSSEEEVRQAALEALQVRRERDYTDVLLGGLRYPWPAVARRAAEALIKLERTDLVPRLVAVLEEDDPRLPVRKEVGKKQVQVVRELVRINHHRGCLMCHAPGNTPDVPPGSVTAQVPVPGEPLPEPPVGYQNSDPDLLVRIDVTYLRQDFSVRLPVAGAHPWPEMQRFDFLVRTREVSEKEARAYRERAAHRPPGSLSPYHRAALLALRELTGRDTEPTARAWRRLLDLPAPGGRTTAAR